MSIRGLGAFETRIATSIRRDRPSPADKWHLDEVVISIRGREHWLWRAVDANGDVLEILVQSRRNSHAAKRFLKKLMKRWEDDVRSRKQFLATRKGTVHGEKFDLLDWGMNVDDKAPAAPARSQTVLTQRFLSFFAALRLTHFGPNEFAFLGVRNINNGDTAFGLNKLPDEELRENMIQTAQVVDKLRQDLGAPIRLTNVYRTPAYSSVVDRGRDPEHTKFSAVDFYCADGNAPVHWAQKLQSYRDQGLFRGGIWVFRDRKIVHFDTGGINRSFGF